MNIDLFYDGVNIQKYSNNKIIKGFTTNISFMKEAGITDYNNFIKNSLDLVGYKPISFQIYEDEDEKIEEMTKKIFSYGRRYMATSDEYFNNIFIKIPVIKTNGIYNRNIIKKLHNEGIQLNITCIYTIEQLNNLRDCFGKNTDVIISIFAGKINDTGLDCSNIVKHAKQIFNKYDNIKILWAACRTIYNIVEAQNQGADIVTIPDSVVDRLGRFGQLLDQQCIECVNKFKKDSESIIL